ncbi:Membrane-bound lytic murein transglycosylase B (35 kDa soluble lytic transglycosylase) (Murein hydrolase B) (Slt35), partial [Durusdinium trenchii]
EENDPYADYSYLWEDVDKKKKKKNKRDRPKEKATAPSEQSLEVDDQAPPSDALIEQSDPPDSTEYSPELGDDSASTENPSLQPVEAIEETSNFDQEESDVVNPEASRKPTNDFRAGLPRGEPRNTINAGITYTNIAGQSHVGLVLSPEFSFGKVGVGLNVPILYGLDDQSIRTEIFEDGVGPARLIRYIRYGTQKRDPVYFRVGELDNLMIGFGGLVNNYTNTTSYEKRKVGLHYDVNYRGLGGVEGMYSDFNPESLNLFVMRPYIRPLATSGIPVARTLEIGATFLKDKDQTKIPTSDSTSTTYIFTEPGIGAFAIDAGLTVLQSPFLQIDVFGGYTRLNVRSEPLDVAVDALGDLQGASDVITDGFENGSGINVGVNFRFHFIANVFDTDLRIERLNYQDHYIPQFFNATYELNKDARILSLAGAKKQGGIYGSLTGHVLNKVRLGGSLMIPDDISATSPALVQLHADLERLFDKFSLHGSYTKGGLADLSDAFKLDERSLAKLRFVYHMNSILTAGVDYYWAFAIDENGAYREQDMRIELDSFTMTSSIRAIEVINDSTVWFAGSKGQYGFTKDGGKSWNIDSIVIDSLPSLQFRAIAITGEAIFLLSVASPALLYRSNDQGQNWQLVYQEDHPLAFYDAMAFWDDQSGIAMGDPTDGCLSILLTTDGGRHWTKVPCEQLPATHEGEAAFAASNSNIALSGNHAWIVSGGAAARVFHSPDRGQIWEVYDTPMVSGSQMTGIYSVDFYDAKHGVIFGGDWNQKDQNRGNKAVTTNGGKTWELVSEGQGPGYRSCVRYVPGTAGKTLVAVGSEGEVAWLAGAQKIVDKQAVADFARNFAYRNKVHIDEITEILDQAKYDESIIAKMNRPAEAMPWHRYRNIFMKDERILAGVKFWKENEIVLDAVSEETGVAPEIIVGILGVETYFGERKGNYRILDALYTLAFAYPKRASFFRSELEDYLLLARKEQIDVYSALGSYAGAMGYSQFMPSSYEAYAVSYEAGGTRDLMNSVEDAIASVANYLKAHRWKRDGPIAHKATVKADAKAIGKQSTRPKQTVGYYENRGYLSAGNLPSDMPSTLLSFDQKDEKEFWFCHYNFYVITRYNHSKLYALAVYQLAEAIKEQRMSQR